jgi:hypothetical protein
MCAEIEKKVRLGYGLPVAAETPDQKLKVKAENSQLVAN